MKDFYIGLVHYPVYNRSGDIVATAVTNFDIHDIARTARTFGAKRFFIIHHVENQVKIIRDIICYWQEGPGADYHPDRREALSIVVQSNDIESMIKTIIDETGKNPVIVATAAKHYENTIGYCDLKVLMTAADRPVLILFGTGWGIDRKIMAEFDYMLQPVVGAGDYNHLPVRAAVAIILDRLCGDSWYDSISRKV